MCTQYVRVHVQCPAPPGAWFHSRYRLVATIDKLGHRPTIGDIITSSQRQEDYSTKETIIRTYINVIVATVVAMITGKVNVINTMESINSRCKMLSK